MERLYTDFHLSSSQESLKEIVEGHIFPRTEVQAKRAAESRDTKVSKFGTIDCAF